MDNDALYWLFSTIAQTYGAIVGIIGMLSVYRLQNLHKAKNDAREKLLALQKGEIVKNGLYILGDRELSETIGSSVRKKEERDETDASTHPMKIRNTEFKRILDKTEKISGRTITFFLFHLSIIVAAMTATPFGKTLLLYGTVVIIISIMIFLISFYLIFNLIIALLETNWNIYKAYVKKVLLNKWQWITHFEKHRPK